MVGDGHLGIWGALRSKQRWNHKITCSPSFQSDNRTRPSSCCLYAPTPEAELRGVHQVVRDHSYENGAGLGPHGTSQRRLGAPSHDEPRITLRGPQASAIYKRVDRAIAVIWKMLMVAEQRFRRLKAPELIEDVYLGAQYADGIAIA